MWALCAACAGPAAAAELTTQAPCHAQRGEVRLVGAGFAPGARYTVTLEGRPLGSGTVDASGAVDASISAPRLPRATHERGFATRVADTTGVAAEATVFVTRTTARLLPRPRGSGRTLFRARVRFQVFGFGTGRPVYLHWVDPRGRVRRTARLGTAGGPCGRLTTTRRRRLLPFRPLAGTWRLQLDTRRRYRRTAAPRVVQPIRIVRR